MKKIFYIAVAGIISLSAACSGSGGTTGGASADSGSHGSSGAADTVAKGSTGSAAQSTSGSDTSSNKKGVDAPVSDTAKKTHPKD
jgi:hypothetical protein